MATTAPIKKGGWRVGSQVTGYVRVPGGTVDKMVTVHFTTSTGTDSTVVVPEATYTPSTVRSLVAAKVKAIEEIGSSGTGQAS